MIRLCSSNLIIVRDENVIQSLNFNGKLEKEWNFKSSIKYLKTIGGVPAKESLLIGLKDGQVLMIFISNIIPVELIKIGNPIQYIDVSMKRQKVAIIDDKNNCLVYDLRNKQLIFEVFIFVQYDDNHLFVHKKIIYATLYHVANTGTKRKKCCLE